MHNSATSIRFESDSPFGLDTLMPELITTGEVARVLGISRQAVLQRVNTGSLVPVSSDGLRGAYLFSAPELACALLALDPVATFELELAR
ncbi:helix-turn-helix domain-containing protein [Curtobacterium sp. PhB146]|uniref:helix-turn-helix domain-containing protein n=1 Tax=Curtobacterium sp. PhB146 TaxID=2485187 RepID=UPI00104498BC|nr:helix-turn-helix domain-containing protein [Curtobacterium sp. PhB146]TCU48332.1 hypothetical protein EDF33_102223 [Curtobacterium sp. PhB146]